MKNKFRIWDNRAGRPLTYHKSMQSATLYLYSIGAISGNKKNYYTQEDLKDGREASLILEDMSNEDYGLE